MKNMFFTIIAAAIVFSTTSCAKDVQGQIIPPTQSPTVITPVIAQIDADMRGGYIDFRNDRGVVMETKYVTAVVRPYITRDNISGTYHVWTTGNPGTAISTVTLCRPGSVSPDGSVSTSMVYNYDHNAYGGSVWILETRTDEYGTPISCRLISVHAEWTSDPNEAAWQLTPWYSGWNLCRSGGYAYNPNNPTTITFTTTF